MEFHPLGATLPAASITAWIVEAIGDHGALAVFGLMALDAILPVGGELIMLYAGVLSAGAVTGADLSTPWLSPHTGLEAYVLLVSAGSTGYLVGALGGWLVGARAGRPFILRHGKWLHLSPARLTRAEAWFERRGDSAVFLGRMTPVIRSLISVPAGVLRRPPARYAALSFLGNLVWCCAFAGIGFALGDRWESVHGAFRFVDYAAVAAALAVAFVLLARARRQMRPGSPVRGSR
jgi:membrane protein DedA with SNARE-associated domain